MSEIESDIELQEFDKPGEESADDMSAEVPAPEAPPADVADAEVEEEKTAADLAPVYDVPVRISAVLGKTKINVNELLALSRGSILELDRKVGEAIDIYVNNRIVARGEVVIVDEQLGVTMTEIIKSEAGNT
ncbi:MAG: flagellar motor switch protein FliN [Robiginitomaculum sp.]|nr:MAG: flagellar motor switch protein FliN [Robiginitomaculum sp.]